VLTRCSIFLVCILFLCGCEEAYDPDIQLDERMVVFSDIAPERPIALGLTKTIVSTDHPHAIRDAQVIITTASSDIDMDLADVDPDDQNAPSYVSGALSLRPGELISLNVKHPELPDVHSSTTVPPVICLQGHTLELLESESLVDGRSFHTYRATYDIDTDMDTSVSGFQLIAFARKGQKTVTTAGDTILISHQEQLRVPTTDLRYSDDFEKDFAQGVLISNSDVQALDGRLQLEFTLSTSDWTDVHVSVGVELRSLSEEYYHYHRQLSRALSSGRMDNVYQVPVTDESNIVSGYGSFAAYNYCQDEISVR